VAEVRAGRPVREHIYIDLYQHARPARARWRARVERPWQAAAALAALQRAA
jgi:hypothetical protein